MENALDPREIKRRAYVQILEQPSPKNFRFRYESEGRFTGSIPGANSTASSKTFPSIRVVGYTGKCYVVVSCVTKDFPHRPHPHLLAGRDCIKGICRLDIPPETMTVTFTNLGIRCVKRKEIEENLKIRQRMNIDPFRTGYDHNKPTPIDLNVVRLCFQVIVQTPTKNVPLDPVVSEPIHNKKVQSDLNIVKLSDCVSYVDGRRKELILLCEKVDKEDIEVRFYEEVNGQVVWEALADIILVHKQFAITFIPPPYYRTDVTESVKLQIQLRRPSDGAPSEPRPFEFLPVILDVDNKKRKFIKISDCDRILGLGQQLNVRQESYDALTDKGVNIPTTVDKQDVSPYDYPFLISTPHLDQPAGLQASAQSNRNPYLDQAAGFQSSSQPNNTNPFKTKRQQSDPTSSNTITDCWNLIPDSSISFKTERKQSDPTSLNTITDCWNITPDGSISPRNNDYIKQNTPEVAWNIALMETDVNPQVMWNAPSTLISKNSETQKFDDTENDIIENLSGTLYSLSFLDNPDQGMNTDSLTRFVSSRVAEMFCQS